MKEIYVRLLWLGQKTKVNIIQEKYGLTANPGELLKLNIILLNPKKKKHCM